MTLILMRRKKGTCIRCYCGREVTSLKGLNIHRRSCFVGKTPSIAELFKDTAKEIDVWQTDVDDDENNIIDLIDLPKGQIKKGVFLPNSVHDWESANEFFRINIHHNANIEDVNSEFRDMQNTIYNYFSEIYGSVKDRERNPFDTNYKAMSKNKLKQELKTLKNQISQREEEIMYVSKLLRQKFKNRKEENNCDHQAEYYKNF